MAASAHGNEACAVEDGRVVSCGNRAADLLCKPAYQPVQLIDEVNIWDSSCNIYLGKREDA